MRERVEKFAVKQDMRVEREKGRQRRRHASISRAASKQHNMPATSAEKRGVRERKRKERQECCSLVVVVVVVVVVVAV